MTSRHYICTLNNPTEDAQSTLESIFNRVKATYLIGQLEKGKEGTIHLQFSVNFKNAVRTSVFKGIPLHAEKVNRDNGVYEYCSKEDTRLEGPWEFGVKPVRRC